MAEELAGPDEGMPAADSGMQLVRFERRSRVLKLRRDGFTYDQIALALSRGDDGKEPFEITPSSIGRMVQSYVAELQTEDAETISELRQIAHERLERMFRRLETEISMLGSSPEDRKQKERLISQQIKVVDRQAKLHGMDAPIKHEHGGTVNVLALADPDHVRQVDTEFRDRFGKADFELPPGDVEEVA